MSNNDSEQAQVTPENTPENKPEKPARKKINTRKLKYGAVATGITVVFVAVVVLVNVLASQLTTRFGLKLDVTKEQLFEISDQTKDYLGTLQDDIDMSVMVSEENLDNGGLYYKLVKEITQKYAANSDKIHLNFYDVEKNPEVVNKYKELYSDSIKAEDIVINCGTRIKVIPMSSLYETQVDQQTYQQKIKSITAEQVLTSAIMFIADPNPPKIAILSSASAKSVETSLSQIKSIYESNGYSVENVDPLTQEISEDYAMVVLPAPYNDLTDTVIDKLDAYLYNDGALGKNLFYMASFDQKSTPKLDAFINEWGISVDPGYVMTSDKNALLNCGIAGLGNYYNVPMGNIETLTDENNKTTSFVANSELPVAVPFARPLSVLFETDSDRETKVLMTEKNTFIVTDKENIDENQKSDHNVVVVGSKHVFRDSSKVSSNVIVSGSAYMFDYAVTSLNALNNQEFLINVTNHYSGKENGITILSKSLELEHININQGQVEAIKTVVVVVLPILIVAAGFVVFIRRKNR